MRRMLFILLIGVTVACSVSATAGEGKSKNRKRLEELERKIVAAIDVPRARAVKECRAIAFGSKPCGGPWRYLIYSTTVTNRRKLEAMVAEYNALDEKVNAEEGRASDCMMVGEPRVALVDGVCQAR